MRKMKDSGVAWIGKIPAEWRTAEIKNYCKDVYAGGTPQSSNMDYWDGDIPWIPSGSCHDCKIISAPKNISKKGFENSSTKMIPAGTAVLAMTGATCANTGYLTFDSCANQSVTAYVSKKDTYSLFVWYLLQAARDHILTFQTGGAQGGINVENCKNLVVPFIEYSEQQKIATFLDSKCSKIDEIIAKQEKIIEKLKEYKLSIITEAVTKGLDPDVEMKDSGVEWIGIIPLHWDIFRVSNLYNQTNETGSDELPILTVSINSGISDRELEDDEKDRIFVRSEDRSKYKRVRPGDLAYNMMRAWQGAFGAARVDGMVSPAYITCRPKKGAELGTRYIEYLLRTPIATEEMHRYSHGIADFRLRLYWPEFKNMKICLPKVSEQKNIADFIDQKIISVNKTISEREEFINKLQDYKKSIIYEVVTGKKEV